MKYDNELLAIKVNASINGTNNYKARSKCPSPNDFYAYWIEKQFVRGRDDYITFAESNKSDVMQVIEKLYTRKVHKKTNLSRQKELFDNFMMNNCYNTELMDWASKKIFPYTTNYVTWMNKNKRK